MEESSKDNLIPNREDESGSNYSAFSTDNNGYWSPYDINNIQPVRHYFETVQIQPGLFLKVTPYIGLAYYDGRNDGTYMMPNGTFALNSGAYPSLYANNQEYGNYITAAPFFIGNNLGIPVNTGSSHELAIVETGNDHCQVNNALSYAYNPYGVYFNIMQNNMSQLPFVFGSHSVNPPPVAATQAENDLLAEYGKVMYYKVEYSWDQINYFETAYYFNIECLASNDLISWVNMQLTDNPFNGDLFYHSNTREVVVDATSLNFNSNYNIVRFYAGEYVDANGVPTVYYSPLHPSYPNGVGGGYFIEHVFIGKK